MWAIIKLALTALLPVLGKWLGGGDKSAAEARDHGRAEQKAIDQEAALDAHKRMDKAAGLPSDTAKGLNDGTF